MREDPQQRATEFLKELYAAGDIDADRFDTSVAGLLAAGTDTELAEVVRSLAPPVPGLPLIRLDATTNIGRVRLRHPGPPRGVRSRNGRRQRPA